MYVEAKPLSTYGETYGWIMPTPEPARMPKRAPMFQNSYSSSSSLSGMEQSIPSFQEFVKRTPPPNSHKPLPPTPLRRRRASSLTEDSQKLSDTSLSRRSSSVYSRTASQWTTDDESAAWQCVDPVDLANMPLRPMANSASTSQLVDVPPITTSELLEPRAYVPTARTPSPSVIPQRSPSPGSTQMPLSILLPPPPVSVNIPKKHLRTVSLEKAKRTINAPGAVHLLPEELRAKALGKSRSRSQEPIRVSSMAMFAGETPLQSPVAPTLLDSQGRERIVRLSQSSEWKHIDGPSIQGPGSAKQAAPLTSQPREASRAKAAQSLGLTDEEEIRGRQMTRGPRNLSYEHYLPKATRLSDSSNEDQSDAQKIAKEYHAMLSEQYRAFAESPVSHRNNHTGSDTDVRSEMKMIPQPLFHNQPGRKPSRIVNGDAGHKRIDSGLGASIARLSSTSRNTRRSRLSISSRSRHRRRSTSGSISISPPSNLPSGLNAHSARVPEVNLRPIPQPRQRKPSDARVSAYYPHIMSRSKNSKARAFRKNKIAHASQSDSPRLMLAADIIAERGQSQDSDFELVSPERRATPIQNDTGSVDNVASIEAVKPSRHRKMGDPSAASPDSPHLLPSLSSSSKSPPGLHLGWSDAAKSTFDRARSSTQSSSKGTAPIVIHHVAPARPLDESKRDLEEPEVPTRRGSIFSGMMDGWRENKAQKRREELKKIIKVVTPSQV